MAKWTFEWQTGVKEWTASKRTYDDVKTAAEAAAGWLTINAINGELECVRLKPLE